MVFCNSTKYLKLENMDNTEENNVARQSSLPKQARKLHLCSCAVLSGSDKPVKCLDQKEVLVFLKLWFSNCMTFFSNENCGFLIEAVCKYKTMTNDFFQCFVFRRTFFCYHSLKWPKSRHWYAFANRYKWNSTSRPEVWIQLELTRIKGLDFKQHFLLQKKTCCFNSNPNDNWQWFRRRSF